MAVADEAVSLAISYQLLFGKLLFHIVALALGLAASALNSYVFWSDGRL